MKNKIDEALAWWDNTLNEQSSVHRISFTTDYQYADSPVPTSVEPIAEKSNVYTTWANEFLDVANANTSEGISADVRKFNHSQRVLHEGQTGTYHAWVNDANDWMACLRRRFLSASICLCRWSIYDRSGRTSGLNICT